jgi:hypothetical protein
MSQLDETPRDVGEDRAGHTGSGSVSRRRIVAAGIVGVLGTAAVASPAEATGAEGVGFGRPGTTVVEFRGRIEQSGSSGQLFTSYGYLTRLVDVSTSALFDGPTPSAGTALLTAYASGDLVARILDVSVHSLDIAGTLTVYQRQHGGADFANPSSFRMGTAVARYDLTLQDVLAVFAAGQGIPTLTGDMVQTAAQALSGSLAGRTLGHQGTRLRMFATGLGKLVDPVTLNAQLEIAGNWVTE